MRKISAMSVILGGLLIGCAHGPANRQAAEHYLRVVSFPAVALKAEPLERIESVEVIMHCARFVSINHIPNDWSAEVVGPVSEETKLRMEAGHGSSSLSRSSDLQGFITVLVREPSCFDITVSLSVFSYDTELHERKVSFGQSDLVMSELPNLSLQAEGVLASAAAVSRRSH